MWFSLFTFLGPGEETVHGSVHGLGLKAQDVEALATHLERTLVLSVNAPPFQPHQEEW